MVILYRHIDANERFDFTYWHQKTFYINASKQMQCFQIYSRGEGVGGRPQRNAGWMFTEIVQSELFHSFIHVVKLPAADWIYDYHGGQTPKTHKPVRQIIPNEGK